MHTGRCKEKMTREKG